jgi:hypothetical protein
LSNNGLRCSAGNGKNGDEQENNDSGNEPHV